MVRNCFFTVWLWLTFCFIYALLSSGLVINITSTAHFYSIAKANFAYTRAQKHTCAPGTKAQITVSFKPHNNTITLGIIISSKISNQLALHKAMQYPAIQCGKLMIMCVYFFWKGAGKQACALSLNVHCWQIKLKCESPGPTVRHTQLTQQYTHFSTLDVVSGCLIKGQGGLIMTIDNLIKMKYTEKAAIFYSCTVLLCS